MSGLGIYVSNHPFVNGRWPSPFVGNKNCNLSGGRAGIILFYSGTEPVKATVPCDSRARTSTSPVKFS